jgi:hypothetical protein
LFALFALFVKGNCNPFSACRSVHFIDNWIPRVYEGVGELGVR